MSPSDTSQLNYDARRWFFGQLSVNLNEYSFGDIDHNKPWYNSLGTTETIIRTLSKVITPSSMPAIYCLVSKWCQTTSFFWWEIKKNFEIDRVKRKIKKIKSIWSMKLCDCSFRFVKTIHVVTRAMCIPLMKARLKNWPILNCSSFNFLSIYHFTSRTKHINWTIYSVNTRIMPTRVLFMWTMRRVMLFAINFASAVHLNSTQIWEFQGI